VDSVTHSHLASARVISTILIICGLLVHTYDGLNLGKNVALPLTLRRRTSTLTFGVYLLLSFAIYYVGRTTPSEACGTAWALTLMFSLAAYTFEHWPVWRSDENEEPIPICIAEVLILFGVKGFELLL
jgi:peptidoglycan/LPS O-acetylase OafA/YrhL